MYDGKYYYFLQIIFVSSQDEYANHPIIHQSGMKEKRLIGLDTGSEFLFFSLEYTNHFLKKQEFLE
jgi:predicted protein tyrosine phosphatase